MKLELRHLRYFVAVAEEGHMTRAAERLGLQQPPLSQQIRALEAAIGARLFERHPRGMRLTEAGRTLLDEARAVLERVEQAVAAVRRTAAGEAGRLRVGLTSSAAFHGLVTGAIRAFREAAPGITLALDEHNTAELVEALRHRRLDVAFIRSPAGDASDLAIETLLEEEMLAALPLGHPLAGGGAPIPLSALANETFVLYRRPTGPGLYDTIIAACRRAGFSPMVGQEAPMMLSTLSLVAAGLGISIVPASTRRLDTEAVAYARLADRPGPTAPLQLAVRAGDASPALARFVAQVRATAAASPAGAPPAAQICE